MKIATWNVNSIRTRLDHVLNWLYVNAVDVLCLQETKVVDELFPQSAFESEGYQVYISGQKAYNGVALISRQALKNVQVGFTSVLGSSEATERFDQQKRLICAISSPSGAEQPSLRILNLYVPNGSEIGSDKYYYKLEWLALLEEYIQNLLQQDPCHLLICGDFNIALEDRDIHDASERAHHIMASDLERQALQRVLQIGLQDAFRKFTAEGGHFSWWNYRAGGFQRNRGWRIDHQYLSKALYQAATACTIDTAPRRLPQPSDHVPVTVELDMAAL
ncbi:MAG: exodeoxyribonuclease III [Acaryochloridaceae cyanobacterium SU_2_1]|nr:exodeoxyribonuclease III [Acaryochloridaceae cyanobacterium SU_2_1]